MGQVVSWIFCNLAPSPILRVNREPFMHVQSTKRVDEAYPTKSRDEVYDKVQGERDLSSVARRAKEEVHHASGVAHTSSHSLSLPFVGYT